MGRICSGCHKELPKAKFSSKQWTVNDNNQRRCKNCTANNIQSVPLPETQNEAICAPAQPVLSQPIVRRAPIDYIDEEYARKKLASFPDDVACWICLEEKKDLTSTSRPLLRECCCRGEYSGWAHYKCLEQYSTDKIDSIFENTKAGGSMNPGEFEGIWTNCPSCKQRYQNDLRLATSAGFMNYIEEKDMSPDQQMKAFLRVESHMSFLSGLVDADHLDETYIEEGSQLANKILKRLLPKIQKSTLVPQQRKLELEADLHRGGLSCFAEEKGDYETALAAEKRAKEIFEILASGAIPLTYDQDYEAKIALVQDDIDRMEEELRAKEEKIEGGEEEEEVQKVKLEKSRRLYELSMRDSGEFSETAISKGVKYAELLYRTSAVKSERLATKLFENSKRIFGTDHWVTDRAEEVYEMTTHRVVSVLHIDRGMVEFDVLGWDMEEDCYMLTPPKSAEDKENPAHDLYKEMIGKAVYRPRRYCILSKVVPVIVFGLPPGPLYHLNNKIGETKTFAISEDSTEPSFISGYVIQFEDEDLEDCEVPPDCVLILTNKLPPENARIKFDFRPTQGDAVDKTSASLESIETTSQQT